jgi:ABC-2 type transport system permease protein
MVLYAIVLGFGYRDLFRTINREFKTGSIEAWLNKPISYIQMKVAESFGKNMPIVFGLIGSAGLFWLLGGQFPLVDDIWLRMFAGIILLSLGLAIATMLYVLVGLSVVWLQEAQPIYLILDKLIMIFGGAFIPIAFFPGILRLIGESLPTGAAIYATQIFYPDLFANLPRFFATQILWLGILAYAVTVLSRAANRRLTVNGG